MGELVFYELYIKDIDDNFVDVPVALKYRISSMQKSQIILHIKFFNFYRWWNFSKYVV